MEEYMAMLDWAMRQDKYPVALRVPGTKVVETGRRFPSDYSRLDTYAVEHRGSRVAIIGAGAFFGLAQQTADLLKEKGVDATLINPRYLSGIDSELLESMKSDHTVVVTLEDGVLDGGFGEKIARYYGTSDMRVRCYGMKKEFLDGYDYAEVFKANRLTAPQITDDILALLG